MCDGVYQLVFLSPEALFSNEIWRDMVPCPVYQENLVVVVIDEFYQHACHVTLGSNITNYIPLWNENLAHVYQTYFSFPSPAPLPNAHPHEEKYGWLARLVFALMATGAALKSRERSLRLSASTLCVAVLFLTRSRVLSACPASHFTACSIY